MMIGFYLIYSPMQKGFVYALAPVAIAADSSTEKQLKYSISPSMSYLLPERTSVKIDKTGIAVSGRLSSTSMRVFTNLLGQGFYGLIVSREYPANIRNNLGVGEIPMIWLTTSKEGCNMANVQCIDPVDLVELGHSIKDFIKKTEESVVIIDGLEYLITQNSFPEVLKFLESLNDYVFQKKTRLLVPLDYKVLNEKELHLLKRELSELNVV
jgi:hypothetical protein